MQYNLIQRLTHFSINVRVYIQKNIQQTINTTYYDQLIRSSSSIGANYIEANDALSKKDMVKYLKISRREAHETEYWLSLIHFETSIQKREIDTLVKESQEVRYILSSIIKSVENKSK